MESVIQSKKEQANVYPKFRDEKSSSVYLVILNNKISRQALPKRPGEESMSPHDGMDRKHVAGSRIMEGIQGGEIPV